MNVEIGDIAMYNLRNVDFAGYLDCPVPISSPNLVWTRAMQRLFILVGRALRFNEPVLLVGETASGKTIDSETRSHLEAIIKVPTALLYEGYRRDFADPNGRYALPRTARGASPNLISAAHGSRTQCITTVFSVWSVSRTRTNSYKIHGQVDLLGVCSARLPHAFRVYSTAPSKLRTSSAPIADVQDSRPRC
ncbi:hypothetical protein C8R47DRAFT_1224147 [Mycena vitilis]|nr:hypothetical protein C8R47DRAFT_1224147 [Mycena vitilis]